MTTPTTNHWTDEFAATACPDGLAEGRQYATMQAWWEATERGDWMCWLLDRIGWPEGARAEYVRVTTPALAEYKRVEAPAWAEYLHVRDAPWAEYLRVRDAARAEYLRVMADALRRIVPNPRPVEVYPRRRAAGERNVRT